MSRPEQPNCMLSIADAIDRWITMWYALFLVPPASKRISPHVPSSQAMEVLARVVPVFQEA